MSKRTVFTTVTPLPAGITRETVMDTLHSHTEMIDLNPLVEERHPIKPPPNASPEEYHCVWYSLTDRVSYLPGGMMSGKVSYNCCFHDLERGLQTHCYAPMGLNIKGKWSLGGSLPGEPIAPVELGVGAPMQGLYIREDVDMKCNIMMTSFVKKTIKKAHSTLVARLLAKASVLNGSLSNQRVGDITLSQIPSQFSGSQSSTEYSPSDYGDSPTLTAHADPTLFPKALNVRNSVLSYNGSIGSLSQRTLDQESLHGAHDQRGSWQNLNANRSPALQHQQLSNPSRSPSIQPIDQGYQNTNHYQASRQSFHSKLPANGSLDTVRPELQFASGPPSYRSPPPLHGHAELE